MLSLKTILAPVDFSERSKRAAEHAVLLAKKFNSKVVLAHVVAPSPIEYGAFEGGPYTGSLWPSLRDLQATAEGVIRNLAEKLKTEHPIRTRILTGDPAQEIEYLAQEIKADLVVIPTHGYGPFRRFILGSMAAKILHDVSCPVFTGAHMPEVTTFNPEPYKRIACAVDLGPHSEAVLRWAWDFACAYEQDLTILHAVPLLGSSGVYNDWYPPETRQAMIDGVRERVNELVAKVGCKAQVFIESANPAAYLREIANSQYIDVMVIGRSPGKDLLGRLRTHAYAIVREAPCPVISV